MGRALITLYGDRERAKAVDWVRKAPGATRLEFKAPRRSIPQNDLMWALLTEVAQQVKWHRLKLTADDWKLLFLDALKREVRIVPNLDNNGFVSLGRSSSDLSREEFTGLIDLIYAFGAKENVVFADRENAECS